MAQQTTTSAETKTFEVLAVDGNQLVVRLPEGTRELTVADDFRFNIDGQQLSVRQLKPGMKGTATITTRTTVTPVTVTEVKNGTVVVRSGSTIIVRTDEGVRSFSQGEIDKRGIKIMRSGKPAQVSDFREGERITATIITSQPPRVLTEKEVQAHARDDWRGIWQLASGGSRTGPVGTCVREGIGGAGTRGAGRNVSSARGQNTAEHGQFVAAPRARERSVARGRAGTDSAAPIRPLAICRYPGRARASMLERDPPEVRLVRDNSRVASCVARPEPRIHSNDRPQSRRF